MKKVFFLGLMLSVLSCKAQQKEHFLNNTTPPKMATLDNKSFDEIQVNGVANFILSNGNSVKQFTAGDTYVEDIKLKDTPFKTQNIYAKYSGAIQSSIEIFYDFPIGIQKFYDGNGSVTKEIDFDKPYQFSIDDLALKIKNEFNIDIMKDNKYVDVSRTLLPHDSEPPEYEVSFPVDPNVDLLYGDKRVLVIDGNTGVIISNTIRRYTK